jgi:hypothetical protein
MNRKSLKRAYMSRKNHARANCARAQANAGFVPAFFQWNLSFHEWKTGKGGF